MFEKIGDEGKYYRQMFEATRAVKLIINPADGSIVDANAAACRFYGYSKDKITSLTISDINILSPDKILEEINKAKSESKSYFKFLHKLSSGEIRDVEVYSGPIKDGESTLLYSIIHDITEKQQAEDDLKISEERYKALYDNAPLSYQSLNEDGCFLDINPAWLRTLGYEREEIIGKWFGDFLHPDWKPHFEKNFPEFKKRGYVQDVEFKIRHKGGHYLDISFEGCIGYTPDGNFKQTYCVFQDITGRKLAQDRLAQSENRLSSIFRASPTGIGVIIDRVIKEVNERFCDMVGYSREELMCQSARIVYPSDKEYKRVGQVKYDQIKRHGTGTVETRLLRKDGKMIDVLLSSTPLNLDDLSLGITFTATDITEIKNTEKKLIKNEQLYREAQSLSQMGSWDYKPDNDTLFWSDELYSIFEIDQDTGPLRFEDFIKCIHPDDRDTIREQAEKGESHSSDYRIVMNDGSFKYIHEKVLIERREDGKLLLMRGIAQDITQRKKSEKALHQSETKFCSMMESMSDPVYICSADYRVEYMNPTMIKRTGRDATGELCYQALHEFCAPCPWCTSRDGSHDIYFESDIVSPKDKHSYHISHSPVINEDNSVSSMIIFRDTTELKKMEAQLLQSQKMESIGNLAGGIAHDFNNILTVIGMHSEVAQMELEEGSDLWVDIEEIRKAGERAANLTRQLLAFSRKQMITPRGVNINKLIADLGKMLARLVSEDIRLETVLDKQVGRIYEDPGQLDQIIINLVVNARDAVKKQSDSTKKIIKISTSQVFMDNDYVVTHEGSAQGWHLQLQVEDSGCGMSEEVSNHIFEPFYTTKGVGEGTGMGLATVYGIVKQNKGSIYVYSELGQGTIFKVYWPIMEEEVVAKVDDHELQPVAGGSEVVLLAEDNQQIREIASRQLRKAGYTVIVAADGREALEKAAAHKEPIDLLFTDVIMPVMGGKELSAKIEELYPGILVLFASGYTDSDIHQDILTLGKNRFIHKPYSKQDILTLIRQLLDDKKS